MKNLMMMFTLLGLVGANAYAASPDALKIAIDTVKEDKGLPYIVSITEKSVAFCQECYNLEFKGQRPDSPDFDSVIEVSTKFNDTTQKIEATITGRSF